MKVLFITEGGRGKGFGHVFRCSALSDSFKKLYSSVCVHTLLMSDIGINQYPAGINMGEVEIYLPGSKGKEIYGIAGEYDAVVIDSYNLNPEVIGEICTVSRKKPLIIDDFNRIPYDNCVVVNPSLYGRNIEYPDNSEVEMLTGAEYIILRKDFWEIPDKKIKDNIEEVLVCMGGVKLSDGICSLVSELSKLEAKIIVISPYNQDECEKLISGGVVKLYETVASQDMMKLMLESDICLCGGGQILNELACCGTPSISFCVAENQENNIKGFYHEGFVPGIWKVSDAGNLGRFKEHIATLKDRGKRKSLSETGRRLVDGQGALRTVEKYMKIF